MAAPRLKQKFIDEVSPKLQAEFNYKNAMQIPTLVKVVLNMGLGEAKENARVLELGLDQLKTISGQKPVITKARTSVAAFKLRTGMSVGCMVTLRADRMWEFLDKLISIALPRVRDFRGVNTKGFDGTGNYTLGVREQIIFPEIDYDAIEQIKGLNITIVTTAKTDEEGRALLRELGMPFRR